MTTFKDLNYGDEFLFEDRQYRKLTYQTAIDPNGDRWAFRQWDEVTAV